VWLVLQQTMDQSLNTYLAFEQFPEPNLSLILRINSAKADLYDLN